MKFDFDMTNDSQADKLFAAMPDADDFARIIFAAKGDVEFVLDVLETTECALKDKVFEPDDKIAARKWRSHLISILSDALVDEDGTSVWFQDNAEQTQ